VLVLQKDKMAKILASKNGTKKDAITQKAAGLFRKKGFASTSMRELAESIGVEASSLYNHIGSKNELLQTLCFKVANDFTVSLTEIEKKGISTVLKLQEVIRFHIEMMLNNHDEVYVANHEWKQLQEPFLSNFLLQRNSYEGRLVEIIKTGIKKKELKNIHPNIAVLTILSAVRSVEFWQRKKNNINSKELESNIIDHLINGLIK